jgi:hypothetical protein
MSINQIWLLCKYLNWIDFLSNRYVTTFIRLGLIIFRFIFKYQASNQIHKYLHFLNLNFWTVLKIYTILNQIIFFKLIVFFILWIRTIVQLLLFIFFKYLNRCYVLWAVDIIRVLRVKTNNKLNWCFFFIIKFVVIVILNIK